MKKAKTTKKIQKSGVDANKVDMKAKVAGQGEGEVGKDGEVFWEVSFFLSFWFCGG